jgi:fructose-1,6-bisphosphatase/inositol monophosphatase family enzyme
MNKKIISKLECELKNIGDQIKLWRENREFRNILELKSFKTQADNKANNLIKHLLNKLDPDAIILSEEDEYLDDTRPEKYWLIDPIDGTASWYDGFDGFVTQLAYIENHQTLYGAVYAPVMNKFWSAIKGDGAFLNGKRLHRLKAIDRLNLVDNYPEPRHISKNIFDNFNVSEYIECGSLGLKSCLVADG